MQRYTNKPLPSLPERVKSFTTLLDLPSRGEVLLLTRQKTVTLYHLTILIVTQIGDFFIDSNRITGITDEDYILAERALDAVKAISQTAYQSVYVIDYNCRNFLYVSDNPLFLCGYSAQQVKEMGYAFYLNNVPKDEQAMLTEINSAGFSAFEQVSPEDRPRCTMSYDFHLLIHGKKMMINHKITPLLLTPTGKVWLALCTVALSSRKEPGHIYFRILGQSSHKEYDLADHSWHTCEAITLKPEEKQILTLAAQGFTTKEIGEQLFRSENTVKFYRKALFEKLEVTSITEALAFATNYGLI